jgi:hypothetical protein
MNATAPICNRSLPGAFEMLLPIAHQMPASGRSNRRGTAAGRSEIASGRGMSQGGISQATYYLWKRNYSGVG